MVFGANIAFALGLTALVAGTFLLVRGAKEGGCCKGFAVVVGLFVVALSILCILYTGYHAVHYWKAGHFRAPAMMWEGGRGKMMRGPHMMGPGMMERRKR